MAVFPKVAVSLLVAAPIYLSGCGGGPSPPPPPGGTTINISFTGLAPTGVAEEIGAGSWTGVVVPANQRLTFTIPNGVTNYAIAYACPNYTLVASPGQVYR